MLWVQDLQNFYYNTPLKVPELWNLSRKHFRIQTCYGRYVKLNRYRCRLNPKALKSLCWTFAPRHLFFSVLNWLFPERVGKKRKAKKAVPLNGEYVVDVDSHLVRKVHNHVLLPRKRICYGCLEISKHLTLKLCEKMEENYSPEKVHIVFSGKRGFHVHLFGFHIRDWTHYNEQDPIKSHAAARFKYSKQLDLETYVFDRAHFTLSVDPMRVVSVPGSLNGETGLVCKHIGSRKRLEKTCVRTIVATADAEVSIHSSPAPQGLRYGYPEPVWAVNRTA